MLSLEFSVVLFLSCLRCFCFQTADPCVNHQKIDGEETRSIYNTFNYSIDNAFSDDRLTKAWYRISSQAGVIATSSPSIFQCGTWYPIWLNGTIPQNIGDQVILPVCLHNAFSDCGRTWNIQIKRCPEYLVYELVSSPVIDSAYCFGNRIKCPSGMSSETGYEPGCNANFPKYVFKPEVKVSIKDSLQRTQLGPYLEPVFDCFFVYPGNGFIYDVQWYINDNSITTILNKAYTNINETELRPAHWKDKYHMNMLVKCSVRVRYRMGSTPGYSQYSDSFVAGVIPLGGYVYSVKEGSSIDITLQSTVPLGCLSHHYLDSCKETLKISYPRSESCSKSSLSDVIIKETCGTDITAKDWNAKHVIKVFGNVDNLYNKHSVRNTILNFEKPLSDKDISGAWDKLKIPDISIHILDEDSTLLNRNCQTYADPNYVTFSQISFTLHITGEYVLYRHKREPYWVHTLSSACYWGTCNVGVAIRSHNSLFVVRTFDVIYNPSVDPYIATFSGSREVPMVNFRDCDDKNMLISRSGLAYTVKLPSGTVITFYVQPDKDNRGRTFHFVNHVTIKPSVLDIEQTEGLCGLLSSKAYSYNDLKERNTGNFVDLNKFANSWFINGTSKESLFSEKPAFINNEFYYKPFCTCVKQASGNTPIANNFNEVNCNLTQPSEQCYTTTTDVDDHLYSSCNSRKRRDTTYLDGVTNARRVSRSTDDNDDVTVEEVPLRYSSDFREMYIPPATGSTTFLAATLKALTAGCIMEVSRNQTLILSPPRHNDDSTIESLLDVIQSQLCLNNCSENGICQKGTCVCTNGFVGDDCSISNTRPPSSLLIPGEGTCGTRKRSCTKTNIYGNFYSTEVWCKLSYFRVVNNVREMTPPPEIVKADFLSPIIVSCPLNSSSKRQKRSLVDANAEGYYISLSNDGRQFGDNVTLIIYDEDCYTCNATTVTCIILSTCPLLQTTLDSTIRPPTSNIHSTTTVDITLLKTSTISTTRPPTSSIHSTTKVDSTLINTTTISTIRTPTRNIHSTPNVDHTLLQTTSNNLMKIPSTSNVDKTTKILNSLLQTTPYGTITYTTTRVIKSTTIVGQQNSEDGSHMMIIMISVAVICLGVIVGIVVICVKCKEHNIRKKKDRYDTAQNTSDRSVTKIQPTTTQYQCRQNSSLSFEWIEYRPKTPDHLLKAK